MFGMGGILDKKLKVLIDSKGFNSILLTLMIFASLAFINRLFIHHR